MLPHLDTVLAQLVEDVLPVVDGTSFDGFDRGFAEDLVDRQRGRDPRENARAMRARIDKGILG